MASTCVSMVFVVLKSIGIVCCFVITLSKVLELTSCFFAIDGLGSCINPGVTDVISLSYLEELSPNVTVISLSIMMYFSLNWFCRISVAGSEILVSPILMLGWCSPFSVWKNGCWSVSSVSVSVRIEVIYSQTSSQRLLKHYYCVLSRERLYWDFAVERHVVVFQYVFVMNFFSHVQVLCQKHCVFFGLVLASSPGFFRRTWRPYCVWKFGTSVSWWQCLAKQKQRLFCLF